MAPRASWKGHLKLSLVSCPVRLYTATSKSDQISFHLLHKDTKNRIQMKPHDPELGVIERADLVKGYEFEKDQYVVVEKEELEEIQIASSKTIEIESFVDASEIDPRYLDTPYYVAPDGPVAEETFRVLHHAMATRNKAALARVVLSSRERLLVVTVLDKGLAATTLRTAREVRDHGAYFDDIGDAPIDEEMLGLAEMIIDQHSGSFDASTFEDRYQLALLDLVKAKIKGSKPVIAKSPERGKVINLMDALKKSLEEGERKKPPAKSKSKRRTATRKTASKRKAAS